MWRLMVAEQTTDSRKCNTLKKVKLAKLPFTKLIYLCIVRDSRAHTHTRAFYWSGRAQGLFQLPVMEARHATHAGPPAALKLAKRLKL
jgi:hypothetical protein